MRKGTDPRIDMDAIRKKQQLRSYYDQIKKGKIVIEDVPEEYRVLLQRYYHIW